MARHRDNHGSGTRSPPQRFPDLSGGSGRPLSNPPLRLRPPERRMQSRPAAVKHLGEGASIINIGSVVSSLTPPNSAVYTATKGAVDAITGVLAKELGVRKIRVNSINPGVVETEGIHAAGFIGSDREK